MSVNPKIEIWVTGGERVSYLWDTMHLKGHEASRWQWPGGSWSRECGPQETLMSKSSPWRTAEVIW